MTSNDNYLNSTNSISVCFTCQKSAINKQFGILFYDVVARLCNKFIILEQRGFQPQEYNTNKKNKSQLVSLI